MCCNTLVFRTVANLGPGRDLMTLRLGQDSVPVPLIHEGRFTEQGPDLSPDGDFLAYSTDETGREEVYIRTFPDVDSARASTSMVSIPGRGRSSYTALTRQPAATISLASGPVLPSILPL